MCWSGEASACLAVLGYTSSYFEYRKKKKLQQCWNDVYGLRAMGIFYFSLMETLQAVNYMVLDIPGFFNSLFSFLGYLHICFQGFFVSFMTLSLIPKKRRDYWMKYALFSSTVTAIALLSRLVVSPSLPGCFAQYCTPVPSMYSILNMKTHLTQTVGCSSTSFLSYPGNWHIAWTWVLNNCSFLIFTYLFTLFTLPCLFGVYYCVIAYILLGPIASIMSSTNPDEFGAIWCLISIALVSSLKIPPWERFLRVEHESWADTWIAMRPKLDKIKKKFKFMDKNSRVC